MPYTEDLFTQLNTPSDRAKESPSQSFFSEYLSLLKAAEKALDKAKPPEPPKEKEKKEWVVALNLATNFGSECTIEKRTNKLKELAADTKGKDVTVLVQSTVKDGDKYKLERFAISNGEIKKLESPGASQGYGKDVESLLKFTNKQYDAKNLGLILDSHGSGNGGLTGDNGQLPLVDMQAVVKNGLAGSGHEKLDMLQFNACLMGQNGVLESTQKLAKHVVASAEPEGTGAEGRDFDNFVFKQLLKNPKMSASELADVAVKHAKDCPNDFPTLAHFDMEKYEKFRTSLDGFGEKMAKLCDDPKQLEVIKGILKDTYGYGGGGGIGFGGGIFDQLQHLFGGKDAASQSPGSEGGFLSGFMRRRDETGKRDLVDFVARVLLAIGKGQLKDEDGSLKKSAQAVLIDGTALIKSASISGESRKGAGGLSAFMPHTPNSYGSGDPLPSDKGGWRAFQKQLVKHAK